MVRFVIAETRDLRVAKRILATGGELPKGEGGDTAAGKEQCWNSIDSSEIEIILDCYTAYN